MHIKSQLLLKQLVACSSTNMVLNKVSGSCGSCKTRSLRISYSVTLIIIFLRKTKKYSSQPVSRYCKYWCGVFALHIFKIIVFCHIEDETVRNERTCKLYASALKKPQSQTTKNTSCIFCLKSSCLNRGSLNRTAHRLWFFKIRHWSEKQKPF